VNTARGPLVDPAALAEALQAGRLAAAGIDVFEQEPFAENDPLHALPNLIATPHVAGNTAESLVNLAVDAARNILAVLGGRMPEGLVNPEVLKNTSRVKIG
jgi:D-3-phosphoglycerate dehydrogenase